MNSIQEFRSAHSIQTGFFDNSNEPSDSKKCVDFLVAKLVFFRKKFVVWRWLVMHMHQFVCAFAYFLFSCYLM